MRILLINDYGYYVGGAEKYFFEIANGLKNLDFNLKTASSTLLIPGKEFKTDFQIRSTGHCFNLDSFFNPINYFQLRKIIKTFKPDLIHIHNFLSFLSPSVLYAAKKYPSVITLHDYRLICRQEKRITENKICNSSFKTCKEGCLKLKNNNRFNFRAKIIKNALKDFKALIAPSLYLKQEYELNDYQNLIHFPHPYSFEKVKSEISNEDKSKNYLYLGRLAQQKGLLHLIQAFKDLDKEDAVLHIAGTGPEEQAIQALIEKLGIQKQVILYGWVDQQKKQELFQKCFVNVLPALWPEVAGLSIYESAEYGIPSIAYDLGGISEFIEDKKTGLLAKPFSVEALKQAMLYLYEHPEEAISLGQKAKEKANANSISQHLNFLIEIYKK